MSRARWTLVAACILPLVGCSSGGVKKKPAEKKAASGAAAAPSEAAGPVQPEIDLHSGLDLDGKRVRVFSPTAWRRASKSHDYLVRYQSSPQLAYPSVIVVAADPPKGFTEVTKGNHKEFVAAVAAWLTEQAGGEGKPSLSRKPAALTVGTHYAVTWAVPGEAKLDGTQKKIERECTAVVVNGRMYTVEAWAPPGKLDDKAKAAARAVAMALAVPSSEAAEPLFPTQPAEAAAPPEPAAKPGPQAEPTAKPEPPAKSKPAAKQKAAGKPKPPGTPGPVDNP
jgi:hypothetical protein